MRPKGKNFAGDIALQRIWRLFELAEKEFGKSPERSKRYVEIARNLSTRNNVTIPSELKRKFCRKCGAYWKEGVNLEVGEEGELAVLKCGECKAERRVGGGGRKG